MEKDEFVGKKLEYLEEVISNSDVNTYDPESKGSLEYVKALNSAIETCRRRNEDKLNEEKMKQQFEIEKMKLDNQIEIEKIRAEATKSQNEEKPQTKMQQALEWAKVMVPTMLPIIAYGIFQHKMLEFEETGSIHSKVGREMHLPRFMK